jgi:hypothetical protein
MGIIWWVHPYADTSGGEGWIFRKLGLWLSPSDVVRSWDGACTKALIMVIMTYLIKLYQLKGTTITSRYASCMCSIQFLFRTVEG